MNTLFGQYWWLFLLRGIVAILLGIMALLLPGVTFAGLVLFLGAWMLAEGILSIVAALQTRKTNTTTSRGWLVAVGIFSILAGLITFYNPFITGVAIIYLAACWALVAGIAEIAVAIRLRKVIKGEGWYIAAGILSILFGILILLNPLAGAVTLTFVFGIYALVAGAMLISLSMRLRKRHKNNHHTIQVV